MFRWISAYVFPSDYATSPFLGLLLLALLLAYLYKKSTAIPDNLPPGPKGWPLIGNLASLNFHWERTMTEWNEAYGSVCLLRMLNVNLVILGSLEAVHEAFVKKAESFSDRMKSAIPGFSGEHGIIPLSYGQILKEQRRFGLTTLREFGMGRRSIEPSVLETFSELNERIDQKCDSDEPFSIEFMVYEAVSGVIQKLVFNKNVAAERKEFKDFLHVLVTGTKYSVLNGIAAFCPPLKVIPPFSFGHKEALMNEEIFRNMVRDELEDHKRTRDPKAPRDLIDCFLNEIDEAEKDGRSVADTSFTEDQLRAVVRDLFLAGSDTTASTFCWLLVYLTRQPELQEKLCEEIDSVLGPNVQPSMWKSDEMPYTKAVIQETLRIRPIAPLGLPHINPRDETVMGHCIPKGSLVMANIFGIHHDSRLWKNPEEFNPARHLDEAGKFVKSPNFVPFSLGARQCIGMQLANIELFLLVASVFQRFKFKLVDSDAVDIRGKNIIVLRPYPYKVIASRR